MRSRRTAQKQRVSAATDNLGRRRGNRSRLHAHHRLWSHVCSVEGWSMEKPTESKWKFHGVRVVHGNELDVNTAQTPGMNRAAAITNARAGAEKLWAGTVVIHPGENGRTSSRARRKRDLRRQW